MILSRLNKDRANLMLAATVAIRSSCRRRRVGCVLTDAHNHVLSTGYNGREAGAKECLNAPCEGAFDGPSGTNLDKCQAIHAEANALMQCPDPQAIVTAYSTTAPCIHCIKLLSNTSCTRLFFVFDYPDSEVSKRIWTRKGRAWVHVHATQTVERLWSLLDSI